MTTIVIADDHRVVRSGLRMLLDREDGFEVVAEAGDVADARRYVRAHRPDVLVLDEAEAVEAADRGHLVVELPLDAAVAP